MYGMEIAVKIARAADNKSYSQAYAALSNELRILRHIRHPHIVLLHGAAINRTTGEIAVILERVHGQKLTTFLSGRTSPENMHFFLQIIIDVCSVLWYLHAQKPQVVHGDLKAANVLIELRSTGPHAKLLDFGLSRLLSQTAHSHGGTLNWMAPELIRNPLDKPKASADIFSFGYFVHFAMTGIQPLTSYSRDCIMQMAKDGQVPALHWPSTVAFCEEANTICKQCLALPANQRPVAPQVHAALLGLRATWNHRTQPASGSNQLAVPSLMPPPLQDPNAYREAL